VPGRARLALLVPACSWAFTTAAAAAEPPAPPPSPRALALLVGTNQGGPGQADLRFAEDDARHVADVLGHIGRADATGVELLLRPSLHDVEGALDRLAARAAEARHRDGAVQALFYYSGHARANALNLGSEELPLADLRARLAALPATVTIV